MGKKASIGTSQQLPVPKFIKGLGPNLHVVQIASYEEMHPITRKITYKLVSLPSLVMFHCKVTRLSPVKGRPNSIQI